MRVTSSHETSTFEVEFEPRAYSKMILHTAKHPHCAVSGLLLASGGRKSSGQIVLTDCIPLFHQSEGKFIIVVIDQGIGFWDEKTVPNVQLMTLFFLVVEFKSSC